MFLLAKQVTIYIPTIRYSNRVYKYVVICRHVAAFVGHLHGGIQQIKYHISYLCHRRAIVELSVTLLCISLLNAVP
jgi:hypothetical protein